MPRDQNPRDYCQHAFTTFVHDRSLARSLFVRHQRHRQTALLLQFPMPTASSEYEEDVWMTKREEVTMNAPALCQCTGDSCGHHSHEEPCPNEAVPPIAAVLDLATNQPASSERALCLACRAANTETSGDID